MYYGVQSAIEKGELRLPFLMNGAFYPLNFTIFKTLKRIKMNYCRNLFFLILLPWAGFSQLSTRTADYDIEVSLDAEKKTLTGKQVLTWTNPSDDVISELRFHMYLNAFKDNKSTFMKESGGRLRGDKMEKGTSGNIEITKIRVRNGEDLFASMQFVQPDDLNTHDRTVMSVRLNRPVNPRETIVLDMAFRAQLPKVFARTGWAEGGYFLVGQWFPKIGVYEPAGMRYATVGQWNCHQFHAHSEFYADFGNYNIRINVPSRFTVAATGLQRSERKQKNNTKTLHFEANDVHDFAWTASPHFKVFEDNWKGVKLRAVMQPEHTSQAGRYFESVKLALDYYEKVMGKYPHPILTMVDPPVNGSGSGGMEYPMFITCGSFMGVGSWARFAELVTVHEFGHQYFQGILASNEFEESWLDEGFNQYMEGRIMDESYPGGSQINLLGFKVNDAETSRDSYVSLKNPNITEVFRNSWEYPGGTYGVMTYQKTATWMHTLDRLIGRVVMDEVLKTYYQRWKFRHPCARDFIAVVNEIVPKRLGDKFGRDMNWYFDQVLYRAPSCDYKVASVSKGKQVTVERDGEMYLPTEILVTFENGDVEMINWSGKDRIKTFIFDQAVSGVSIDPQQKNMLDLNRINNSYAVESSTWPATKYAVKVLFWVQNLMLTFAGLV